MGGSAEWARGWYARNRDAIRQQRRYLRRKNVARSIYQDARKDDRRKGRANDLTLEFVTLAIARPCQYCGDETLRRSLDRIDNAIGHLQSNVVPCCERCNYVRRDMPYGAWLVLAAAMRQARMSNLFDGWTGAIHRRREVTAVAIAHPRPLVHGTLAGYKRCGPPTCAPCKAAMRDWKRERRRARSS